MKSVNSFIVIFMCTVLFASHCFGDNTDQADLAKQAQNPVADMISVPIQENLNFGVGPKEGVQSVLNVQPVLPFELTKDLNLITRTIIPFTYQPLMASGTTVSSQVGDVFGLGDISLSLFFSPAKSGKFTWGVGPLMVFPTGTEKTLGARKLSVGPTAVGLVSHENLVFGALISNVWSVAGDDRRPDVNAMSAQPFFNINFSDGWYATTSPVITANWYAKKEKDIWTVPVGGGFGKVFKIGNQAFNAQAQAFYNVVKPTNGPDWSTRFQLQLLFPK